MTRRTRLMKIAGGLVIATMIATASAQFPSAHAVKAPVEQGKASPLGTSCTISSDGTFVVTGYADGIRQSTILGVDMYWTNNNASNRGENFTRGFHDGNALNLPLNFVSRAYTTWTATFNIQKSNGLGQTNAPGDAIYASSRVYLTRGKQLEVSTFCVMQ